MFKFLRRNGSSTKTRIASLEFTISALQRQIEDATKSKGFFSGFRIDTGVQPLGRALTPEKLRETYRLSGPVKRAVDIVAHQVSQLSITLTPAPTEEADKEKMILLFQKQNAAEEAFRDVVYKTVVDLLVLNYGAMEIARAKAKGNAQVYSKDAATFRPKRDEKGHVEGYVQDPVQAGVGGSPASAGKAIPFDRDQLIFIDVLPKSHLQVGAPIIESIANEIAFIMNITDKFAHYSQTGTLPDGILELGKIGPDAYERSKASFEAKTKSGLRVIDNVDKVDWHLIDRPVSEEANTLFDLINRSIFRAFGLVPVNDSPIGQSPDYIGSQLRQSELVRPIARLLASHINTKLADVLGDIEFSFDLFPEHGPRELTMLVKGAVVTPNEARRSLGFEDIEGGDELIISSATGTTTAKEIGSKKKDPDEEQSEEEEDDGDDPDGEE